MTTTTTHRPGCPRPGWTVEPSRTIAGISVARCIGCGAVEIRTNHATAPAAALTNERNTP